MLHVRKIPLHFWGEALHTVVYVLNQSGTRTLRVTPLEAWNKKKPNISHLKVFGCDAFVHILKQFCKKLESKSSKCIFIGYCQESTGYRQWDKTNKKMLISCNVIFHEDIVEMSAADEPQKTFVLHSLERRGENSTTSFQSHDESGRTISASIPKCTIAVDNPIVDTSTVEVSFGNAEALSHALSEDGTVL